MRRRRFLQTAAFLPALQLWGKPATERIRLGQVGAGHAHAAGKYAAVRSLVDDFEQAGVAEKDAALRGGAGFSGARWRDEAELLADASIRGIIVETSLVDAVPAALRAIRAGKHVHLDKPGGDDHASFAALLQEAERRNLRVQMGYMLRHNPGLRWLRAAVQAGEVGEITRIEAVMNKSADPALRQQLLAYPGHGMFELGCHMVDLVVDLLGTPLQVESQAERTGADALPNRQTAVFTYKSAVARILCDHGDPAAQRLFRVEGRRGWIEVRPLESRQISYQFAAADGTQPKESQALTVPSNGNRYDAELKEFAHLIRGGKPQWNVEHDILVHALARRAAGLS